MKHTDPYKETLETLSNLAKDNRLTADEKTAIMLAYGYIYYNESLTKKLKAMADANKNIFPPT